MFIVVFINAKSTKYKYPSAENSINIDMVRELNMSWQFPINKPDLHLSAWIYHKNILKIESKLQDYMSYDFLYTKFKYI